ncbi:MAG: CSLREA domain-containing protein [Actinomycetota bacterium]
MRLRVAVAVSVLLMGLSTAVPRAVAVLPVQPITITVNSAADTGDGDISDDVCDTSPGGIIICTLRAAIETANHHAETTGRDAIEFNIATPGEKRIQPVTALPIVTDSVVVDGTTQPPGLTAGCSFAAQHLCILLDGTNAGASSSGLDIRAPNTLIRGLDIGNFGLFGIVIGSNSATATATVQGNFLGTDPNGTSAQPNGLSGAIVKSDGSVFGGTLSGQGNLMSGNQGNGLFLEGDSTVQGNLIGTDITGAAALPNGNDGIEVEVASPVIGGTAAGAGNVISGNAFGIRIDPIGADPLIQGNLIGTAADGHSALGNSQAGVFVDARSPATIGGTDAAARNVISGNSGPAVRVELPSGALNPPFPSVIQGNLIGLDEAGTTAVPNEAGIEIASAGANHIGGTVAGAGNIIAGNTGAGVSVASGLAGPAAGNLVQGNRIGVNSSGVAFPNGGPGVLLDGATRTQVGAGVASGANTIANNAKGVVVAAGSRNRILRNALFANTGLGIDLGDDGITPNDAGDADTGPNALQNFPSLTKAVRSGGQTTISGRLVSKPSTKYIVRLFSSTACDPSGFGEGRTFLAQKSVTTDATGKVTFQETLTTALPLGRQVTATASDPAGNTSEFGHCRAVTNP